MIQISIVDERGAVMGTFDAANVVREFLAAAASDDSLCLRFVDPYGDTVFNQLQVPVLISELQAYLGRVDSTVRSKAEALVDFVEQARGQPHVYVKFVGD